MTKCSCTIFNDEHYLFAQIVQNNNSLTGHGPA